MNLKILMLILMYWCIWIALASVSGGIFLQEEGVVNPDSMPINTTAIELNESGLTIFNVGGLASNLMRFGVFVMFGLGLPSSTPAWASILFVLWCSAWTFFTVGWFISALLGGT